MAEDVGLCTYVRHHKQKITLFLAAMRSYRDELERAGMRVHHEAISERDETYEERLGRFVKRHRAKALAMWEVEDKFFERRMEAFARERGLTLKFLPSPMFLTPREMGDQALGPGKPLMARFYAWQRKRLRVMVDAKGQPLGGKWSFDEENRKRLGREVVIPETSWPGGTARVREVIPVVQSRFGAHPGELSAEGWWLATERGQARQLLRDFLEKRFEGFGPYEDALSGRDPVLFHSALAAPLNMGLLTPREVLDATLAHAAEHEVALNSVEGFVRQVIGWREYIRLIYQRYSERQETSNFFGHHRKLTPAWYSGTTGILPMDAVIRKLNRYGWAHHIERLMVAANLMTLCEIEPAEVHRWFMEMFVDSSDWVMGPNVYGMGTFADGGILSTKPYLCGSNYILKMSDHPASDRGDGLFGEDWREVMDGLYWRFIGKHREFFKRQARANQVVANHDRLDAARLHRIAGAAERFLARCTA
jgi:deoxyribodipyrimidine photolyase-related protein